MHSKLPHRDTCMIIYLMDTLMDNLFEVLTSTCVSNFYLNSPLCTLEATVFSRHFTSLLLIFDCLPKINPKPNVLSTVYKRLGLSNPISCSLFLLLLTNFVLIFYRILGCSSISQATFANYCTVWTTITVLAFTLTID